MTSQTTSRSDAVALRPATQDKTGAGTRILWAAGTLAAAFGALLPLATQDSPFLLVLASQAVIAALVALSLDLLMGNTGLLSFGHAGWYGIGTYIAGLTAKHLSAEMLIVLPVTALLAAALAGLVGMVLVRQIGKTFAILTLAFSQILYGLVFINADLTGGEDGLQGIPLPTLAGQPVAAQTTWYWLLYTLLVVALLLALGLRRSPLGRAWLAIRTNPERARFIGIDVPRLKLLAYMGSAGLAALAGGLFALFNGATAPDSMSWFESGKILMYVVLGGVGTIVGPALGAGVFTVAEHYVSSLTDSWLIYFGGLFVLIVIVAPGGIFGLMQAGWTRWRRAGTGGQH